VGRGERPFRSWKSRDRLFYCPLAIINQPNLPHGFAKRLLGDDDVVLVLFRPRTVYLHYSISSNGSTGDFFPRLPVVVQCVITRAASSGSEPYVDDARSRREAVATRLTERQSSCSKTEHNRD
jgi:hypothetical protein